jgi:transcriptional regulator of arginine metabolism
MNKNQRILAVKRIIGNSFAGTQEELLEKLGKQGYQLTQATLSRDLKALKVAKKADPEKGYVYVLPDQPETQEEKTKNTFPLNGFMWLKFSNHMGVIKTKPGYAAGIASMIDNAGSYEILATIAGDDTVLIIPVEGIKQNDIKRALILIMPELEGKI